MKREPYLPVNNVDPLVLKWPFISCLIHINLAYCRYNNNTRGGRSPWLYSAAASSNMCGEPGYPCLISTLFSTRALRPLFHRAPLLTNHGAPMAVGHLPSVHIGRFEGPLASATPSATSGWPEVRQFARRGPCKNVVGRAPISTTDNAALPALPASMATGAGIDALRARRDQRRGRRGPRHDDRRVRWVELRAGESVFLMRLRRCRVRTVACRRGSASV